MLTFYKWLIKENQSANVIVDLSNYNKQIKAGLDELENYAIGRAEKMRQFKFDPNIIKNSPYPGKEDILKAFSGNDSDAWHQETKNLSNWYFANRSQQNYRDIWRHAVDQHEKLHGAEHDPEAYVTMHKNIIEQTSKNMDELKSKIISAINSIPSWSGSIVRIIPEAGRDGSNRISLEPETSSQIYVGNKHGMFLYLIDENGKAIIDDILEGGFEEEEFFDNNNVKNDYYLLINELRNPGSSTKGKILTLYTARPTKDREFYSNTSWLPVNLFLTNSLNHVDGLAHDLGSNEVRDIWIVKMDSKYLTQTLDGAVKYYMVSQAQAPIKSIRLY